MLRDPSHDLAFTFCSLDGGIQGAAGAETLDGKGNAAALD